MKTEDLHSLLLELTSYPAESQWIEFKMGKGSITNVQIGEYIYALHKRDQTIENKGTTRNPLWILSLSNFA